MASVRRGDVRVGEGGVVVGGVAGVPHLVTADAGDVEGLAAAVADDVDPAADLHGSAAYRRALTHELARRALDDLADASRERTREPA